MVGVVTWRLAYVGRSAFSALAIFYILHVVANN